MCATDADSRISALDPGCSSLTPGRCVHIADIGTSLRALHLHAVADERAAALVRLAVVAHAARLQDRGDLVVVVLRQHVRERPPEVPEEAVAGLGALDDAPGEHGQPRARVVAAALA